MDYFGRDERILELCHGKRVLHLGCVGFTDVPAERRLALAGQTLHAKLSEISQTTGIDYSREVIESLSSKGIFTNVVYGDAENLDAVPVDGVFDVIVVGDLIEHLSNPGRMLDGLKRFVHMETVVLITTPNAFGLPNFMRHLFNRFQEGQGHVSMFNQQGIENLLRRHGFCVKSCDSCYQAMAAKKKVFRAGLAFFRCFPRLGGTLFLQVVNEGARSD